MFKKLLGSSIVLLIILCAYTGLVYAEEVKAGVITDNSVNVRQNPEILDGNVITQLDKGTKVTILSVKDGWTKIEYKGKTGWVRNDLIKEDIIGIGTVTTEVLNVRTEANTECDIVTKLDRGDKVTAISKSGDWYRIKTSDGKNGWVSAKYITFSTPSTSRGDLDRESQQTSSLRQKIVNYSKNFIGYKYQGGCEGPSRFDCSGFTYYIFGQFGIKLNRASYEQVKNGEKISKSDLQPGDLVFFTRGGSGVGHVGMYIGDNKFIHAEDENSGVKISSMSESYYVRHYYCARNVLG